jgi:hypothetical protein
LDPSLTWTKRVEDATSFEEITKIYNTAVKMKEYFPEGFMDAVVNATWRFRKPTEALTYFKDRPRTGILR